MIWLVLTCCPSWLLTMTIIWSRNLGFAFTVFNLSVFEFECSRLLNASIQVNITALKLYSTFDFQLTMQNSNITSFRTLNGHALFIYFYEYWTIPSNRSHNANVSLTKKMHLNLSLYNWSVTIFESQEILPLDKNLLIFNQIEHLNESMCNIV